MAQKIQTIDMTKIGGSAVANPTSANIGVYKNTAGQGPCCDFNGIMNTMGGALSASNKEHLNRNKK